jgi:hypothetical protein
VRRRTVHDHGRSAAGCNGSTDEHADSGPDRNTYAHPYSDRHAYRDTDCTGHPCRIVRAG